MTTRFAIRLALCLVGAYVTGGHATAQTTYYWNTASGNWNTGANWSNNPATGGTTGTVPGALDFAWFNQSTVNGDKTIALDANYSILGITFGNSGTTALQGDGITSRILTIGSGGIAVGSGAGNVTLGDPTNTMNVTLGASQSWSAAAGTSLYVNGNVVRSTGIVLNITGSVLSTTLPNDTGDTTGIIGTWATYGTGAAMRYANVNYTTNVISGLVGTAAADGTGVTDTTGKFNYDVAAAGTMGANASVNTLRYAGATGALTTTTSFTTNSIMNVGGGTLTITGNTTIGATKELVLYTANGNITISNAIVNNGGGASALTVAGSGTVILNGANTYTGATNISGGILQMVRGTTNTTSGFFVNAGGNLQVNTNGAAWNPANFSNAAVTLNGGTYSMTATSGNGQYGVVNGLVTATAASTISVSAGSVGAGNASNFFLDGGLQGSAPVTISSTTNGLGVVIRSSNTNYTGTITVTGNPNATTGTGSGLSIGANGSTPNLSSAKLSVNGTLELGNVTGGMAWANGSTAGTTTAIDSLGGTGVVVANFGAASTKTLSVGNNNGSDTFSGVIAAGALSTLSLIKNGTGIQTLSGANTVTGTTTVSGGTIKLGTATTLQTSAYNTTGSNGTTIGIDVNGFATPSLGGLLGSVNLASAIIGYGGVTGLTLNPGTGLTPSYSGNIIDGAAGMTLTKTGAGTQTLGGANTYTGGTTISTGTLQFAKLTATPGTGTIAVGTGSTLAVNLGGTGEWTTGTSGVGTIGGLLTGLGGQGGSLVTYTGAFTLGFDTTNATSAQTYSGNIANVGTALGITKLGTGTLVLTGTNTYTGVTTISGGTLQIGDGTTDGSVAGNISNTAALVYNIVGTKSYSGVISGTGSVTKTGTGTQTLSGANSYTGATTVSIGTLTITGVTNGSNSANVGGNQFASSAIAVTSGAVINFNTGGNFSSANTGTTITGDGTVRLSSGKWWLGNAGNGGNPGAGGTTISMSAGGVIDVRPGATLSNDYANAVWAANLGSINVDGSFDLRNNNVTVGALTGGGAVFDNGFTNTLTIGAGNASGNFSGTIGVGGTTVLVTKIGTGTQTLSGASASTYTGATTVNAGTLLLDFANRATSTNLLAATTPLTLGGGTLSLLGKSSGTTAQTLASLSLTAGTSSSIVLTPNGGTSTTLTITSATVTTGAGATVNFNYSAGTTNGATVGNNIISWNPTLTAGGIIGSAYTVTDSGGTGFATVASGKVVRLADNGTSGLPVSGGVSTGNYFVNQTYSTSDTTTPGSLVEALSGTVVANTVTVDTTGLALGANLALGGNTLTLTTGMTFNGGNPYAITATAGGGLQGTSGGSVAFYNYAPGTVTISAPILANGTNALTFAGTGTTLLSGANTYTGGTTIAGGTLSVGSATALGANTSAVTVRGGAALDLNGTTMTGTSALTLNGTGINGGGALTNGSATAGTYAGLIALGSASSIVAGNGNIIISNTGTISGAGNGLTLDGTATGSSIASIIGTGTGTLAKQGTGTWTLTGANTFTGGTTIAAGTLRVDLTSRTGTINPLGTYSVGASGTLEFKNTTTTVDNTLLQSTAISGSGTFIKTGAGYLTLHTGSSVANFTGTIDIQAGTLSFNNMGTGASSGVMSVNVASGATFDVRFNSAVTLDKLTGTGTLNHSFTDSVIVTVGANNGSSAYGGGIQNTGGTLGLTKNGTGTQTLSGGTSLTYTGPTTVNAGTLKLVNATALASAITVNTTGTLELNSTNGTVDNWYTVAQPISGIGTINKTGTGWIDVTSTTWLTNFNGTLNIQQGTFGPGGGSGRIGSDTSTMTVDVSGGALFDIRATGLGAVVKIDKLTGTGTVGTTFNNGATFTVGTGGGSSQFDGTIVGNGSAAINLSANPNATAVSLIKVGAGTFTLTGTNTYTGTTTITGGILSVTKLAAGGSSSGIGAAAVAGGNLVLNGGTLQLSGATTAQSTNRLFTIGTSGATLDASGTGNGAMNFTGTTAILFASSAAPASLILTGTGAGTAGGSLAPILGNSGTGANITSLTKTGTGTWTLSGTSTYTGATTISAGTLLVNGNNSSATGAVAVNGGTLGGTGTVGGAIAINNGGTLAPGSGGIAPLLAKSDVAFANGGTLAIQLGAGTSSDLIDLSGGAGNLGFATGSQLNLTNAGFILSSGSVTYIVGKVGTGSIQFSSPNGSELGRYTFGSGSSATDPVAIVLNPADFASMGNGSTFMLMANGSNLELTATVAAAPEPAAVGLIAAAALALCYLPRLRRRTQLLSRQDGLT